MLIDSKVSSDPLRRRLRRLLPEERREEAAHFVDLFHRENELGEELRRQRRRQVLSDLDRQGWYDHTTEELAFGARVAWRNSATCVGRLFWKSLEVVDCREVGKPDAMAAAMFDHLRLAHQGDRVRSVVSIFAPVRGRVTPPYVENGQLVQYAGYVMPEGGVLGDPLNVEFTRTAKALGWRPDIAPGRFDILPLIIRGADGERLLYRIPPDCYREVLITHPLRSGLDALKLRWYAVPVVSDMILSIGGIDYPCAPFNGHYVATEIASRDLIDEVRYNLLGEVGSALGLDRSDPLWKDEALTELNRAVLHSYRLAGVSICDHHTAGEWFLTFIQAEQAAARNPSANWAWIVPPQASAACPTFHLPMTDYCDIPNFYRSRASDGGRLGVSRIAEMQGAGRVRLRRLRARLRNWIHERSR